MIEKMISSIDGAISDAYCQIKKEGKIISGIEATVRQISWERPELASYVKKKLYEMAEEKGDLT